MPCKLPANQERPAASSLTSQGKGPAASPARRAQCQPPAESVNDRSLDSSPGRPASRRAGQKRRLGSQDDAETQAEQDISPSSEGGFEAELGASNEPEAGAAEPAGAVEAGLPAAAPATTSSIASRQPEPTPEADLPRAAHQGEPAADAAAGSGPAHGNLSQQGGPSAEPPPAECRPAGSPPADLNQELRETGYAWHLRRPQQGQQRPPMESCREAAVHLLVAFLGAALGSQWAVSAFVRHAVACYRCVPGALWHQRVWCHSVGGHSNPSRVSAACEACCGLVQVGANHLLHVRGRPADAGLGQGLGHAPPMAPAGRLSMSGLLQVHAGKFYTDVLFCRSGHGDVVSCAPLGAAVDRQWAVSVGVLPRPEHSGRTQNHQNCGELPCSALELVHLTIA